jgi:PPOX class probable F420-dependent enzyme
MDNHEILIQDWVIELLGQPAIARIATCNPQTLQPHVVPVWYEWDTESLWISAFRSTRKARDLLRNPRISVLIDDHTPNEPARAVLLEGAVEVIDDPLAVAARAASIYTRYLGEDGVQASDPQSWIVDPENLIFKLTPEKVYAWGGG